MAFTLEEFFHTFRQNVLADAETNRDFLEAEFTLSFASQLTEAGITEGFEACYYRPASGGMRVDGYWFGETSLDLFITDFAGRETVQSLTQTDVAAIFKRAENFFLASAEKKLYTSLEETSQGYGLARQIAERLADVSKVSFFLLSERNLSERVQAIDEKQHGDRKFAYHIWDISRLYRLETSRDAREELIIDFSDSDEGGIPCLPANTTSATYQSYLMVIPATRLADLYERYGSRLLEQNVRSFLQMRASVNKGIRTTILTNPEMFFAYNNGLTATARRITTAVTHRGIVVTSLTDLQIVNGGQTTATLFHTRRKDGAALDRVFVQMKLTIIDDERSEEVVPRISEYANTQNRINAADFFANHPYHIRMEEISRRRWAPAVQGAQRETKWFYERARGQYADGQSKGSPSDRKRFEAEFPKTQMMTKTDIAKFENVWDENPVWVNMGAQKNFARYAQRIGAEWEQDDTRFNDAYFQRLVARAIIFRATEKIVSSQPWYNGGYRANVVAYTIALLAAVCTSRRMVFDAERVWNTQSISPATGTALTIIAELVYQDILRSGEGVSNVTEWCKREACWIRLKKYIPRLADELPRTFFDELVSESDAQDKARTAAKTQKIYNGIEAQKAVLAVPASAWAQILRDGKAKRLFSPKEISILEIAAQIPAKIPSEKQSQVLMSILEKAKSEAIYIP